VVVLMDSDLQDRPEDIPKLVAALRESGCAMAIASWVTRDNSFVRRACVRLFAALSARLTDLHYPAQLGVFRAVTREAVDAVKDIPETTGTILSLLYWSGLSYVAVALHREPRAAGKSGYDIRRLCVLTADRIFSYSLAPVRIATLVGVLLCATGVVMGVYFAVKSIFLDAIVPGWAYLAVAALLLFGLNFFFIGMVGEYLGRVYLESKGRPRYITERIIRR